MKEQLDENRQDCQERRAWYKVRATDVYYGEKLGALRSQT